MHARTALLLAIFALAIVSAPASAEHPKIVACETVYHQQACFTLTDACDPDPSAPGGCKDGVRIECPAWYPAEVRTRCSTAGGDVDEIVWNVQQLLPPDPL